jgi:hypothetical protein
MLKIPSTDPKISSTYYTELVDLCAQVNGFRVSPSHCPGGDQEGRRQRIEKERKYLAHLVTQTILTEQADFFLSIEKRRNFQSVTWLTESFS